MNIMKSIFEHQSLPKEIGFTVKEYIQPYFSSPFHFHDLHELIFIVNSYGKVYAGNKVLNFKKNDIFMFGPGLAHCFYNEKSFVSTGEAAHAIVIFFKHDFLGENFFFHNDLIRTKQLLQESTFGLKVKEANEVMETLFMEITKSKGMDSLIILLRLLNILSSQNIHKILINTELSKKFITDNESARLEPLLKYIFENFKNDLNIKEAASLACMNEAAFCRYFKSRTEQTFSQFVNRVRITHATRLLATEERSISDICYECGYENISYFNRQFKDITGQTPIAYRKQLLYANDSLNTETEEEIG